MSHFTVMVIGDDYEEQLAPFNEQPKEDDEACKPHMTWTVYGKKDNYHGDTKAEAEKACADAGDIIEDGPYCINSQGKWDWYQLGGRWSGMLKHKPDSTSHISGSKSFLLQGTGRPPAGYCDSVLKKDLDLEGMFAEKEAQAIKWWDEAMSVFGDTPDHKPFNTMLEEVEAKFGTPLSKEVLDDTREKYHAQPRVQATKVAAKENENSIFHWRTGFQVDDFFTTREAFIERMKINSVSTYAILHNGEWISKENMGWFGMSNDNMTQEERNEKYMTFLKELPEDTRLSVVDCHI